MTEPVHATTPELAEPRTPLWLPAVGAALFLTAGLLWAATPAPRPVVQEESSDAGAEAASDAAPAVASAAPPPTPSARPAPSALPPSPSASAAASAALQRILAHPPRIRPPKQPPKDVH